MASIKKFTVIYQVISYNKSEIPAIVSVEQNKMAEQQLV